jgi:hypothetical protein
LGGELDASLLDSPAVIGPPKHIVIASGSDDTPFARHGWSDQTPIRACLCTVIVYRQIEVVIHVSPTRGWAFAAESLDNRGKTSELGTFEGQASIRREYATKFHTIAVIDQVSVSGKNACD